MATLASMDLNLLVPLRALLHHRSVTRAAEETGVSQPTMSNTLRRLRSVLDDELLIRTGRTYELTARARALLEPLEAALRAIDSEVIRVPAFSPEDSRRTFTVAASNATAAAVLADLARGLAVRAPNCALHVVPLRPTPEDLLGDGGADLVLLPDTIRTRLPRERLYDDEWLCVLDAANTDVGDQLTCRDLARMPHVVFDMGGLSIPPELMFRALVPDRRVQATVSDFLTIPFLLRGTPMISVLQGRLARLLSSHGLVRVARCPVGLPGLGIDMVWNPRGRNDPAQTWLRGQLRALV